MGISTHVLNTASGKPAKALAVTVERRDEDGWNLLNSTVTDDNGRVSTLVPDAHSLTPGIYRIQFDTAAYFDLHRTECLYPYVEITFEVRDAGQHYHIPLLLTANGYTTYRGS